MNFDDFPTPYDREVPRRIGEARQELSDQGIEVMERMVTELGDSEGVVAAMELLPQHDVNILLGLNKLFEEAYYAAAEESRSWGRLARQMQSLIRRAQELDPEFAALGNKGTVGEAVAILRRHGEPLGVSDEVLEMVMEVPPGE
jgi:hypothetical protein